MWVCSYVRVCNYIGCGSVRVWGILGLGLKARLFFVFKHCVIIMGIDKKSFSFAAAFLKNLGIVIE